MAGHQGLDIRELSNMFDSANRDVFLSLYVDLSDRGHESTIRRRASTISSALGDNKTKKAFEHALESVLESLRTLHAKGRSAAIFTHLEDDFLRIGALGAPIPTSLVLDASPYILPLARFNDEYEEFLLVLIDGQFAEIHLIEQAASEQIGSASHTSLGRHKRGGWSQMRYQRIREGVVQRFYDDVAQQLDRILIEQGEMRIIIAGPGSAKQQFRDRMSKRSAGLVIAVEDSDISTSSKGSLMERFTELAKQEEGEREAIDIARLRKELLSGTLAVTGIYDVLEAAAEGRLERLLVLEGNRQPGVKCEPCDFYMRTPGQTCPTCGSEGNEVELLNEATEAAIRTSAHVEFTGDPLIKDLGGIAALLRW